MYAHVSAYSVVVGRPLQCVQACHHLDDSVVLVVWYLWLLGKAKVSHMTVINTFTHHMFSTLYARVF